jgi:8-oxo-dGTP pyrophosphatase MutT (NUDIX family)
MENGLFSIGVNIILFNDHKVLILDRNGKYLLPGGRMQAGESWKEALQREVHEETEITNYRIQGIVDIASSDDRSQLILTVYGNTDIIHVNLSEEHQAYRWADQVELSACEFWHSNIKTRINKAFELYT